MIEDKDELPLAKHTSTTKLKIYEASYRTTTVRLECIGFGSEVFKINERTTSYQLKVDMDTMIVLRDVLNRWHEAEIVKRGKE